MQVTAILRAALRVKAEGIAVFPEIMVPLIACVEEVRYLRKLIEKTAAEVFIGKVVGSPIAWES